MASETDQRATDFEEIRNLLQQYPAANLLGTEGDPPESYEIEYNLTGLVRNDDGSISKVAQHKISITLPFGYPHFPPAVKPLTPIFHPNIDPDAVRIASYWQQTPSLSNLILHIGEIICGKTYNLEDAFNQEAADWYAEHSDELPFDDLTTDDVEVGIDLGLELELELDIADDSAEENQDFDLSLERDETPQDDAQGQLEEIQEHIARKELTIASRLLADIPASSGIAEADAFRNELGSALKERDRLLQELQVLEDEDNFEEAQDVFEKIKNIAIDTPGLADIGQRLRQSQSMLDTFSIDQETKPEKKDSEPQKKKKRKSRKTARKDRSSHKEVSHTRSKIIRKARTKVPIAPILISGIFVAIIIGSGLLYTKDTNTLREVEREWQEVRNLAKQKKFPKAKQTAQDAQDALHTIFVPRTAKTRLKAEISVLLESEEFQKGLAGEAKYKGVYLPVEEVNNRQQFDRLIATAKVFLQSGESDKTLSAYENALKFAAENGLKKEAAALAGQIHQLRMDTALAAADRAENAGEWENAAETYRQALEIAQTLANDEEKEAISKKHAAAAFKHELTQSKKSFTGSQWQETITMLERAKKLLDENSETASVEKRKELEHLLSRSRLYQMLSQALKAYEKGDSDTAINIYKKALGLLDTHQVMFSKKYSNYKEKISQTVLKVELSKTLNAAGAAEKSQKVQTALQHYKAAQKILRSAHTALDKNLLALEKNIAAKIKSLSTEFRQIKKTEWLNSNFERIFRNAYPKSRSSTFSNPAMTFVKKIKGWEIYKITCSERNRRSSYRLELTYQYNPATDQWKIYK